MNELDDLNTPKIEFVILADRAEVLNGKLYMMGGGWDRLTLTEFAQAQQMGMAIGIQIPWNATNQPHRLTVRIETSDNTELSTAQIGFTPGRPPILRDAESQRVIFAIGQSVKFPSPGTYTVKALVNDNYEKRSETFFHVTLGTQPPKPL